jgi:hypothetical protein
MFYYDPPGKPYSMSVLFNRYGDRLAGVGVLGTKDAYEEARSSLDVTLRLNLGSTKLKFVGKNLLDSGKVVEQGGIVMESEDDSRSYSLSISRSG